MKSEYEEYVDKTICESKGFVRTPKGIYKLTALERVYSKGRLRYGDKRFSEDDRLRAGNRLNHEYEAAHFNVVGISWKNSKIDSRGGADTSSNLTDLRSRYLTAIRHIPREFWPAVRRICIENLLPDFDNIDSARRRYENMYLWYCDLCRGLDRLIEYYTQSKIQP